MDRRVCSTENGLLEYSENLENFRHVRSWVNGDGSAIVEQKKIFPSLSVHSNLSVGVCCGSNRRLQMSAPNSWAAFE